MSTETLNNIESELTPAERIDAAAEALGLTMTAQFVPWSRSRNKAKKQPSLNWVVTLHKTTPGNGHDRPAHTRAILTTDYGAGCGHCPAYKAKEAVFGKADSYERRTAIAWECENGFAASPPYASMPMRARDRKSPLKPELRDVLSSLVLDAMVLDHDSYEDWADNCGYDRDSRKGEAIYRACLEIALKLRNAIGEAGLEKLRAACQDY